MLLVAIYTNAEQCKLLMSFLLTLNVSQFVLVFLLLNLSMDLSAGFNLNCFEINVVSKNCNEQFHVVTLTNRKKLLHKDLLRMFYIHLTSQ